MRRASPLPAGARLLKVLTVSEITLHSRLGSTLVRSTPDEDTCRAIQLVYRYSSSSAECAELLAMLGLISEDERDNHEED